MSSDATTVSRPRAIRFKVEGLDCQNEVRALKRAVGPIVGDDQNLSFDTKTGTMEVATDVPISLEAIDRAVASTGMRAEHWSRPQTKEKTPLAAPLRARQLASMTSASRVWTAQTK